MLIADLMQKLVALPAPASASLYLQHAREIAGAVPANAPDVSALSKMGIVGAGTMGRGIALLFAQTGFTVYLCDQSEDALSLSKDHIAGLLSKKVRSNRLSQQEADETANRIQYISAISDLPEIDLVIEAVPEIMALKKRILKDLVDHCSDKTIITSNTSTLDVDEIAKDTGAADRIIGTHFFLPAQVNPLLELVPSRYSSPEIIGSALALAKRLGKNAVIAGNCDGFIGNRIFDRFHQEAMYLVEEGASPDFVDEVLEGFGFSIGPFRCLDMIGNDIPWGVRKQRAEKDPDLLQPRVGDAICEAELYGLKNGIGWYGYGDMSSPASLSTEAQKVIDQVRIELRTNLRDISAEEVITRCVLSIITEGLSIVDEDYAQHLSDIDMVQVTGYGFPAQKGGPVLVGSQLGQENIESLVDHFAKQDIRSKPLWIVPNGLEKLEDIRNEFV